MNSEPGTKRILVAGVPRSGSTWLYNAIRLLHLNSDIEIHAAWVADYNFDCSAKVHLIKVHKPDELKFDAPVSIFTTYRKLEDRLASLARMGWVSKDPKQRRLQSIEQIKLYQYWQNRSDHEVLYEDILSSPAAVILTLAEIIGLQVDGQATGIIANMLADMKPPTQGHYDPVTLLHQKHRSIS